MEFNMVTPIKPQKEENEEKEYIIKNLSSNKNYKIKIIKGQNSVIFNAKAIGDI